MPCGKFYFSQPHLQHECQAMMSTQCTWLRSPTFLHPSLLTKNNDAWTENLTNGPDCDFLLRGLKEGFRIVSCNSDLWPREVRNYKLATGDDVRNKVEKVICEELQHDQYCLSKETHISQRLTSKVPIGTCLFICQTTLLLVLHGDFMVIKLSHICTTVNFHLGQQKVRKIQVLT